MTNKFTSIFTMHFIHTVHTNMFRPAFGLIISIVKPTRCTNVSNLFWNDTLHVSDGLSVHRQEFTTVHTATGICQTDTAAILLASSQQYLSDRRLLRYVQS